MTKINKLTNLILLVVMLSSFGSLYANDVPTKEWVNETQQQRRRVTGIVADATGPVIGATVTIKGTTTGVVTDLNGNYAIEATSGQTLIFSYLGYTTQEIKFSGQATLDVKLIEDTQTLGEVVVTALGITKDAKKVGYAITTVSASDLLKTGSPNFATALYGKASGVRIQNTQGGVAGGVSINVRGLSSLNGNTQPLVVLNGVPIRNGNASNGSNSTGNVAEKDFSSIGTGNRVRSNGLVDINPEDIESLSILKGAAATALYGSEAANGAIIITSKKAKGKGTTIDANVTLQANMVANVPSIQNKYGPGGTYDSWTSMQLVTGGFITDASGGVYPEYVRSSWGPAYDGRDVLYIDGTTRKYSVIDSSPWTKLFRNGSDQIYNIAVNHGGENSNTRFSYTHMQEVPNALTGDYQKHNFNLVGNLAFNDKLSVDYSGNYISQHFVNRPGTELGIYGGYNASFGSFLDIDMVKKRYKNSMGYINSEDAGGANGNIYTPDETFKYGGDRAFANGVRDMLWGIYENTSDELEQRLISSVAPTWKIFPFLTAKARVSTDYTTSAIEDRSRSQYPAAAYPDKDGVSGGYSLLRKSYQIIYGDVMLFFDKQISDKIGLTANAGWQGRTEDLKATSIGTNGGLAIDNVFDIKNGRKSTITPNNDTDRKMQLLKTAWVGSLGVSYGDYVFLDVTGRQETSSTLPKGSRDYFYPSASVSFLYTDALRDYLPDWYKYGKLRVSYGIVGNAPEAYAANMAYNAQSDPGGFIWNQIPGGLGNNKLKPETTKEFEIGLESKFLGNRAGFEVSYYNRNISDMLISLPLSESSGAGSVWTNSGTMVNKGIEFMVYGDPIQTRDFTYTVRANMGFNKNNIEYLADGVPFIGHKFVNAGGVGGTRSYTGRPMGDYVLCDYKTVEDENSPYYGQRIVNSDGNYVMNSEYTIGANAMPKVVGGLGMSFNYKGLALDVLSDFRFGGYVFNYMYWNTMAMGVNSETINREGDGFLDYTSKNGGNPRKIGIILDGVVDDGNGGYKKNDKVIAYDSYIASAYGVGGPGTNNQTMLNGLFKNNWWKLREVALTYTFPKYIASKMAMTNLSLSIFGRNLFYITKSIKDYDPETSNSTDWQSQLVIGDSASPSRTFGVSLRASF
ncbi:MAG: SusC/RagA family TonB-linked outer membrane protein [Tannerellaceae bacterium]|jgi:TonB-linked SusC/RagA family outer membrane protein|nr:SusC/RagA family TonB-linked outer membrane protein [Tannerellaceae bacterium]